ncbi:uncharacterized protein LOC117182519 [Belonocnema kinseyi]|uniref:uncharacterized protein LOC117182519 n=1 Tax=Belonocnema kinseyi TaxID=2817044 RepID=UPI00143D881C|nr:uncharacterized protein LOC117182519 [Belonocnema kinseyi]
MRSNTDLELPKDARTLMKAPRQSEVTPMCTGKYCHYGMQKAVEEILKEYHRRGIEKRELHLTFNIDGLPIFKSSEKSLWLILCSERNLKNVYVIGMYWGYEKPSDPNAYLTSFAKEAIEICQNGVTWKKKPVKVYFHALICDAPAKSMCRNTKGHSGYRSCSKCTIRGKYMYKTKGQRNVGNGQKVGGRVCFPGVQQHACRSDEEFALGAYVEIGKGYQLGSTELTKIPGFKGVSGVP